MLMISLRPQCATRVVANCARICLFLRSNHTHSRHGTELPSVRNFVASLQMKQPLPFSIPSKSWLSSGIGNTPVLEIENDRLWVKLEGYNPSGSLKDRTLSSIVLNMISSGKLRVKGDTLCLVTSGSAGLSLIKIQEALAEIPEVQVNVVVVMPEAYACKPVPSEITGLVEGKVYHGFDHLETGTGSVKVLLLNGAFIDVLAEARAYAQKNGWLMVDQHFDDNSMAGHRSTALELLEQCPGVTDVVCATGTGATAAGLREHLPAHIKVHSRPAESGSIDGLSNVGRYNNFCNPNKLEGYDSCVFPKAAAFEATDNLLRSYGIRAGPSTGATYWLAQQILETDPKAKIAFVGADASLLQDECEINTISQNSVIRTTAFYPRANNIPRSMSVAMGFSSKSHVCSSGLCVSGAKLHSYRRAYSTFHRARPFSTNVAAPKMLDTIIIGGGPVGASSAWFLSENEAAEGKQVLLIHDPTNKGAHEDWSRLARLSFDGPEDEMSLSRHAVSLLDLADEIRSYQSGAPVIPLRPGMLFVASPGTNLAKACTYGEENGYDEEFVRRDVSELEELYPGNTFNLPANTLAWTHPVGLCVSPLELAAVARGIAQAEGVDIRTGRASVDMAPEAEVGPNVFRVTTDKGERFDTRKLFVMAGAQSKKILSDAVARDPVKNAALEVEEMKDTYITAISTVRYKHRNHPGTDPVDESYVPPPITLGQLEIPELCNYQANFSVVAEEYGDVLKTRLSGATGSEVIETVADMHKVGAKNDEEMAETYGNFFGTLFPYLETEKPLDFNRCVTYRNHNPNFSGTSLLEKVIGDEADKDKTGLLLTTPGCFGVGVKFGPALGQAAAAHVYGEEVEHGMHIFRSGSPQLKAVDAGERIERAW